MQPMHPCIPLLFILFLSSSAGIPSDRGAEVPSETQPVLVDLESWIDELSTLLQESRYPEVLARGRQLAEQLRADQPDGSLAEARILDMVVSASCRSHQVMDESALEMARRAVDLKEAALGVENREFATSLINLATLFSNRYEGESSSNRNLFTSMSNLAH